MARRLSRELAATQTLLSTQPMLAVEKLLYDKRSAAFALSVSVSTINNMLAKKQLSYRRCGAKVLIPAADIRRISKLEQLHNAPVIR